MKTPRLFTQAPPALQPQETILRDAVAMLLEPDELRFSRLLLARLLDEGCNLPIILARPRFYTLMVRALRQHVPPDRQPTFRELFEDHPDMPHRHFVENMALCTTHLPQAKRTMTFELLNSLGSLKREWQRDALMCREQVTEFEQRLTPVFHRLCPFLQDGPGLPARNGSSTLAHVRRRIYLTMTTSLLRHLRDYQAFQAAFGSVPQTLAAMQQDHAEFVRWLNWCCERIPYCEYLMAQIFWRTLETIRLETCRYPGEDFV